MFEVATTEAHREAIARAHSERSAAFAAGFAWLAAVFSVRSPAALRQHRTA